MIWDTIANIPPQQLLTFVVSGLLLNLAPGQDVVFASASGIQGGPKAGALAGVGVGLGSFCHLLLATLGLGAVIAAHPNALWAVKYVGAAYLLWLAWKSWRASAPQMQSAAPPRHVIRRAMLSNMLNPKPVLFLLAFLPQFTSPAYGPVWQQMLGLGLIFVISGTIITALYGIAAGYAGRALIRRMGIVNRIAAVMFALLAVRLVTK